MCVFVCVVRTQADNSGPCRKSENVAHLLLHRAGVQAERQARDVAGLCCRTSALQGLLLLLGIAERPVGQQHEQAGHRARLDEQ